MVYLSQSCGCMTNTGIGDKRQKIREVWQTIRPGRGWQRRKTQKQKRVGVTWEQSATRCERFRKCWCIFTLFFSRFKKLLLTVICLQNFRKAWLKICVALWCFFVAFYNLSTYVFRTKCSGTLNLSTDKQAWDRPSAEMQQINQAQFLSFCKTAKEWSHSPRWGHNQFQTDWKRLGYRTLVP